jgi:glycosyltransferase involved in cell wall biosynthesis
MAPTKFGSLEAYMVEMVRQARALGVATVIQYEERPASEALLGKARGAGAAVEIAPIRSSTPQAIARALWMLLRVRPTHVIAHFVPRPVLIFVALFSRFVLRARVVCVVHGLEALGPRSKARHAYDRCDAVVAVSDAGRNDLLAGGVRPSLVHRIYLGLIPRDDVAPYERAALRRRFGFGQDDVVVANIAFDDPVKGVDVLVMAIARLADTRPEVRSLQIGIDPGRSRAEALVESLGAAATWRFAGIVDDAWRCLPAADVYVQPSRSEGGVPLAIMEAMRAGLPVVATEAGGNREGVAHGITGLLVPVDDPTALAAGIDVLVGDTSMRHMMGRAARDAFDARFDGRRSVGELLETVVLGPRAAAERPRA